MQTNRFIVGLWREALMKEGLPEEGVALVEDPSYETATAFMQMTSVLEAERDAKRRIPALRNAAG